MFYVVDAHMIFDEEDEANDYFHDCEMACSKTAVINPGLPNEERSHVMLHHCDHDQGEVHSCIPAKEITCPELPTCE